MNKVYLAIEFNDTTDEDIGMSIIGIFDTALMAQTAIDKCKVVCPKKYRIEERVTNSFTDEEANGIYRVSKDTNEIYTTNNKEV